MFFFRLLLVVLDLSAPPGLVEVDSLVQAGCNILHQSSRHAMLVIYPQKYSGQTSKANLTAARRIEDMLLKCNANIDCDIALHFSIEGMHMNDKRTLGARARLVVSETLAGADDSTSSPFMHGSAARGKISDIPLIRIKEMKRLSQPGAVQDSVVSWNLSPAERTQQKGPQAVVKIVAALMDGIPGMGPDHRLDIMELQLMHHVPDWCEGAWQMRRDWQSDSSKPQVSYFGLCRDMAVMKSIQGHLEATLMSQWWEREPSAGPSEPQNSDPVEKPILALASWTGASPVLSEMVLTKFNNDSDDFSGKWNALCNQFREFVASTIDPLVERSVTANGAGGSDACRSSSPDFEVEPKPVPFAEVVFPATAKDSFDMDKVFPSLFVSTCPNIRFSKWLLFPVVCLMCPLTVFSKRCVFPFLFCCFPIIVVLWFC